MDRMMSGEPEKNPCGNHKRDIQRSMTDRVLSQPRRDKNETNSVSEENVDASGKLENIINVDGKTNLYFFRVCLSEKGRSGRCSCMSLTHQTAEGHEELNGNSKAYTMVCCSTDYVRKKSVQNERRDTEELGD